MEPGAQDPGSSSSEDESRPPGTGRPPWKVPTRHSTPEGQSTALCWSPRPRGQASHPRESPVPAQSNQDGELHFTGLSPRATFRKRRLSTIHASEEGPSVQSGSCLDPWAPEDDPPMPASLARLQRKAEEPQAKSRPHNPGLPGIPDRARRRRRDPKGQAAVMLRVRQWEARLLQDIEAAVHHELTIEPDGPPSMGSVQVGTQEPTTSD